MFGGVVVGTCIFIIICIGASITINNYVQKDVNDPRVKEEYKK